MNSTQKASPKGKLIIAGLILLALAGLFIAKVTLESRAAARMREDLALYEPLLKLEDVRVNVSLLGRSITCADLVYSMPDLPGLTLKIGKIEQKGVDLSTLLGNPGDITRMELQSLENMQIFHEDFEQPLVELEYYEMNGLAYPYREMREVLLKNKGAKDINKSLTELLGYIDRVATGPDMGRNLKVNAAQAGAFDFTLGSFATSGQADLDARSTGFDMGVSNMRFNDFFLAYEDVRSGEAGMVKLGEFNVRGLKYNYKAIVDALAEYQERQDPLTFLVAVIPSLYDYEFDRAEARNLAVTHGSVMFSLDSVELGPRTLKEQGPNVVRNVNVKVGPLEVFTMAEAGMDKAVLSDRLVEIIKDPGKAINDPSFLSEAGSAPYNFLKGIRVENLYLHNLNAKNLVRLANWRSDLEFGERANIKSSLKDLYLSQEALLQARAFTGYDYELEELLTILSAVPGGVTFNSDFSLSVLVGKVLDFTASFSGKEPALGDFRLAVEGVTGEPQRYEAYGEPLLRKLEVFFEDAGLRELLFDYAVEEYFVDRDDLYNTIRQSMAELAAEEPALTDALMKLQAFLLEGGALEAIMVPPAPVLMEDLDMLAPEELGLQVEYTAPAARP